MEYSLTVTSAKNNLNIALTKAQISLQGLINEESGLVYNEDNLQSIADFIQKAKKAESVVDAAHKEMKAPYLEITKSIDASKRAIMDEINIPVQRASEKYHKLCSDIAQRAKDAKDAEIRKTRIMGLIETNVSTFAIKIAESKSPTDLLDWERKMNLELTRESQYGEFLPILTAKLAPLRALIPERKETIRKISEATKASFEAATDEQLEIDMAEREFLAQKSHENSVRLMESASTQLSTETSTHEQVIQEAPKARRTEFRYEVVDMALFIKKHPELVLIEPNDHKIKGHLAALRMMGTLKEETVNGLRIFKKITY